MPNELLELENRRLRSQLQMVESRARMALESLEVLQEHLLFVARDFPLVDIAEMISRLEAAQQLLRGGKGGAV